MFCLGVLPKEMSWLMAGEQGVVVPMGECKLLVSELSVPKHQIVHSG